MLKRLFLKSKKPRHEIFAEMISNQFRETFGRYNPQVDGIGQGYFFNNYIVVVKLNDCMVRFVLDRNDVYVETAPSNTYPIMRPRNEKNLWFDVSVIAPFLDDKSQEFKWFYQSAVNPNTDRSIQDQLSQLDKDLKKYWEEIFALYATGKFANQQEEIHRFRDRWAEQSWKVLGWNQAKNPVKSHRSVFGHFPEYAEKATDLGNGNLYFGVDDRVWNTLWLAGGSTFWAMNKKFIDNAVDDRKDEIVLATEARNPESFYAREIKYIVSKLGM